MCTYRERLNTYTWMSVCVRVCVRIHEHTHTHSLSLSRPLSHLFCRSPRRRRWKSTARRCQKFRKISPRAYLLCVCQCMCLSAYVSVSVCMCLSVYVSVSVCVCQCMYVSVSVCVCQCICLSVYVATRESTFENVWKNKHNK